MSRGICGFINTSYCHALLHITQVLTAKKYDLSACYLVLSDGATNIKYRNSQSCWYIKSWYNTKHRFIVHVLYVNQHISFSLIRPLSGHLLLWCYLNSNTSVCTDVRHKSPHYMPTQIKTGGGGTAPTHSQPVTRSKWVVATTLYPRNHQEWHGTHSTRGWVDLMAGLDGVENFAPTRIRSSYRPAYNKSLYQLHFALMFLGKIRKQIMTSYIKTFCQSLYNACQK